MIKTFECPHCGKQAQIILINEDTGDVKIEGVFFDEENNDLDIKQEKCELENIEFG